MEQQQRTVELSPRSSDLIEQGDVNELTRHVNALVAEQSWDELVALGDRCRLAFERGKQLWAVSAHIEYRLALEAPGPWAAFMLETGSGRFSFGPLPEVAASTHTWAELAPHLHGTPQAAMAAHERVMHGDDLTEEPFAAGLPEVLDLPLRLEPWEPRYALAEYHAGSIVAEPPRAPPLDRLPEGLPAGPTAERPGPTNGPTEAGDVCAALEDLVGTWARESNGQAHAVGVRGSPLDAIATLGVRATALVELVPATALALMAWAAASGGAHGRRPGAAPGRFAAWWVLAALGGHTDTWPLAPGALGEALHQARWYAWEGGEPATGWALRLAFEAGGGPRQGWAWAITATDAA